MAAKTPAAARLRLLVAQFAGWQIPTTVQLAWGEPLWQVRSEVASGAYDLIIVGADPPGRLYRFLVGNLVGPLLRCAGRPVLVAYHTPGQVEGSGWPILQTNEYSCLS